MSTTALLDAPPDTGRTRPTLRDLAPVLLAGGIAGFGVGGLGGRVAMRIAALASGDQARGVVTEAGATVGRVTVEGTLFLLLFGGIGGHGNRYRLLPRGTPVAAATQAGTSGRVRRARADH